MALDRSVATGFGSVAALYDAIRPSYPDEAITFLTDGLASGRVGPVDVADVADVGAGTGKMTDVAVRLGHRVTAVEPDARMLDALRERLPTVRTLVGSGERTGLEDASVDVIVSAQAFHWMDPDAAFAEFARVLRPGGALGLVWNIRDTRVGWVQRFNKLLNRFGDDAMAGHASEPPALEYPGFGPGERVDIDYTQPLGAERLVELAASRSYVIALDDATRHAFLDDVRAFAHNDPDLAGRATFDQPYVTRVFRFLRT